MSPIRRDGEGRPQFAHSWESLVERQIRASMQAGDFDNLPHAGERIPIDDDGSEMALAHHILRQAGFAPGWIATDAEIRVLLAQRDTLIERVRRAGPPVRNRDREAMRALVERINVLVLRLEHEAPTTRQHRRHLDLARELAALEGTATGEEPSSGESQNRR
jgi:DnaJ-like protein